MIDRFSRGTQSNKQTNKTKQTNIHNKQTKQNKQQQNQNKQNKTNKTNQPTIFCFISVFISSTHLWIITSLPLFVWVDVLSMF